MSERPQDISCVPDNHAGQVHPKASTNFVNSLLSRIAKKRNLGAKTGASRPMTASSFGALMVYGTGAALSYFSQLAVARTIGASSFGIYAYVFAWVTMLGYLSTLGFHVSLLRFIPTYRATERWSLARGVIEYSQRGAALVGLLVVLTGVLIVIARDPAMRSELALTFIIGLITVPIISQHLISASLVRSFGGIVQALAPERVVRDSVLLTVVLLAAWSGLFVTDAKMAMIAALISALATLTVLRIFLKPLRPKEIQSQAPENAAKEWLQPTMPIMFIVLADSLISRSGVIVLGMSGNTLDAGIFAVALSMSLLTALPRMAVAAAFAPNVSHLNAIKDQAGLQTLARQASILSLIGALTIAIPLLLLNDLLLALFGPSFVDGAPIVVVLVIGQVFAAACGPQQHIITMTGNERSAAIIMSFCALANLAACVFVINAYGTFGVAVAMTVMLIIWNIAMGFYIQRRLKIVPGLMSAFTSMRNKG